MKGEFYFSRKDTFMDKIIQHLENLPDEILKQRRFFRVGGYNHKRGGIWDNKMPIDKWNNTENQSFYNELNFTDKRQLAGFDICGHGKAPDYLVLDFDHVLDADGNFVNDDAQKWYNLVAQSETYCEKSISKHGLHFLINSSSDGEFSKMASGKAASLNLGGNAKIEIFNKPNGRYFLLTGDVYNCAPKTPISADCSIINTLLDEIRKQNTAKKSKNQSNTEKFDFIKNNDTSKAREMTKFIPCKDLDYNDWLAVGMILKTNGNPIDDWINWSRADSARFDEQTCRYKWDTFSDNGDLKIGTLCNMAKKYGYQPPNEVTAAIDLLSSIDDEDLSPDTVLTPDVIHAAALLKIKSQLEYQKFYERLTGKVKLKGFAAAVKEEQINIYNARNNAVKIKDSSDTVINAILQKLEWKYDKHGFPVEVKDTEKNFLLIFNHDPLIKGLIGYNEFTHQDVLLKPTKWKTNGVGTDWTDSDDAHLRCYIRTHYTELKSLDSMRDNITVFSRKNSFHPIKKYLESLVWDGTPRAKTFFSKFLKVEESEYSKEVTFKWLLGAIARIYHEGCDFQFALVLHGKQGIGKGFCLQHLGREWYVDIKCESLDDSHSLDTIERGWIVEIPELSAGRKTEVNAMKAFLSDAADTRRKAYARRAETTPRHCVFAISVNDELFLRDLTGNRRFKILECHGEFNADAANLTPEYVNQVWAEMFHYYQEIFKDGFNPALLRLSQESNLISEEIANHHLQDDGLQGEVDAFLDKPILPACIWERLTKEERRTFFINGRIKIDPADVEARIKTQIKRATTRDETLKEFRDYQAANIDDNPDSGYIVTESKSYKGEVTDVFTFYYGSVERESTCAAEIFNECFGNDRRKSMPRINEILHMIDGWTLVNQQQKNFAGAYGNQKKIYRRDEQAAADSINFLTKDADGINFLTKENHKIEENHELQPENLPF